MSLKNVTLKNTDGELVKVDLHDVCILIFNSDSNDLNAVFSKEENKIYLTNCHDIFCLICGFTNNKDKKSIEIISERNKIKNDEKQIVVSDDIYNRLLRIIKNKYSLL